MNALEQGTPSFKVEPSGVVSWLSRLGSWLGFIQQDASDAVAYSLAVPGYRRRDFTVEVHGRQVIVRGERAGGLFRPQSRSSVVHAFTLPETLDEQSVRAAVRGGILRLTVRKKADTGTREVPRARHQPGWLS